MASKGTVIVTGCSQGIGAAVVHAFLDRGYAVVATSRNVKNASLPSSANLALAEGDIGQASTAEEVVRTAISTFGSIDHVVNNAVAPGIVDTPMHTNHPKDFLKTLSPMGTISDAKDIADAVVYLAEARHVTGEVLHVDGGSHQGTW